MANGWHQLLEVFGHHLCQQRLDLGLRWSWGSGPRVLLLRLGASRLASKRSKKVIFG